MSSGFNVSHWSRTLAFAVTTSPTQVPDACYQAPHTSESAYIRHWSYLSVLLYAADMDLVSSRCKNIFSPEMPETAAQSLPVQVTKPGMMKYYNRPAGLHSLTSYSADVPVSSATSHASAQQQHTGKQGSSLYKPASVLLL